MKKRSAIRPRTMGLAIAAVSTLCLSMGAPAFASNVDKELPLSSALNSPVIAEGNLLDAKGKPVRGAELVLTVWPRAEQLAAMRIGETASLTTVGRAVTASDGTYELRVADPAALKAFASSTGEINFEIVSATGGALSTTSFTQQALAVGAETLKASNARAVVPVDLNAEAVQVNLNPLVASESTTTATKSAAIAAAEPDLGNCRDVTKLASYNARHATVARAFSTNTKVITTVTYTTGASSTFGIGIAAGAGVIKASTNSTSTFTQVNVATYPAKTGIHSTNYRTEVDYAKFKLSCMDQIGNLSTWTTVRPVQLRGGASAVAGPAVPAALNCASHQLGTSWSTVNTSATKLTNGVSISGAIGVDLSAKTGYNASTKIKYNFKNAGGKLCGTTGVPASTTGPGLLVAKP